MTGTAMLSRFRRDRPTNSGAKKAPLRGLLLVSVFVFAFFFGTQSNEALAFIVPSTAENGAPSNFEFIFVNQSSREINSSVSRRGAFDSYSSRLWETYCEANPGTEGVSQILSFARSKFSSLEIVMAWRPQWPECCPPWNKLIKNPTFDDGGLIVPGVNEQIKDFVSLSMNVAQNYARTVGDKKFFASHVYSFVGGPQESAGRPPKRQCEYADEKCGGGNDEVMSPVNPIDRIVSESVSETLSKAAAFLGTALIFALFAAFAVWDSNR
jgi:hypothetical protein